MRHLGRHMRIGLAAALACCAAALTPAMASADVSDLLPAVSPPGANDFTCRPAAAHPAPVVLVHGTFEGAADNWATASPKLKAAGYCVFALEYGNRGTGDIAASAGLGGAGKVDDLVGLAPSNHGTTNPAAIAAGATFCPACEQQTAGSAFLTQLNAGDETPGAVSYTQIETRYDEVVTPYTSAFLAPGPRTANILLQDACPAEVIDHHEMPNDGLAIRWALQALARSGPADPAHPPSCV